MLYIFKSLTLMSDLKMFQTHFTSHEWRKLWITSIWHAYKRVEIIVRTLCAIKNKSQNLRSLCGWKTQNFS